MLSLWLYCYRHNKDPRWKDATNHWNLLDIVRQWKYGYRRFCITHKVINLSTFK